MGVMDAAWWWNAIWSVIPTIVIGAMFGLIIYAALNADRKVRQERKSIEVEERERFEAERARRAESQASARGSSRASRRARARDGSHGEGTFGETPGDTLVAVVRC